MCPEGHRKGSKCDNDLSIMHQSDTRPCFCSGIVAHSGPLVQTCTTSLLPRTNGALNAALGIGNDIKNNGQPLLEYTYSGLRSINSRVSSFWGVDGLLLVDAWGSLLVAAVGAPNRKSEH